MPKITKTLIDSLKVDLANPVDVCAWDAELPGFGVRVQRSGRKTYMVRYRLPCGTQRKIKLARCVDLTPDKARDLARKVFAAVAEGRDPSVERSQARQGDTMDALWSKYLAEHAEPFKKDSSVSSDKKNWRVHIESQIATKKITAVTRPDVLALMGSLSFSPATANQCVALLSKMFSLAEMWKLRPVGSNPCLGVKKYKINERELILTPMQLAAMDSAIDRLIARGLVRPESGALIRLLAVTGCRKCEVMHAKKSWVDRERRLLLLPDSKVGQRRIPLSGVALAIIDKMGADGEWLIPGRKNGQPLQNPYRPWSLIKTEAGLPTELRLHDLRHTTGSLAHMAGASQREVAELLGHKQLSTTERYLHGFSGSSVGVADNLARWISVEQGVTG